MDAPSIEHNIAHQLSRIADRMPDAIAIASPRWHRPVGRSAYRTISFGQLDQDSTHLASHLCEMGLRRGQRIVLMVRPGIDFISLTFALFKSAAVVVLIDPGMGRQHLLQCLEEVRPDGFVAVPTVQWARAIYQRRFPRARLNVTVGRFGGRAATTLEALRCAPASPFVPPRVAPHDAAAIIFTTGSTGPPKGVQYEHGNFAAQVQQLRDFYQIEPGEIDLPGFPLFALFNCAMGVTTIIPDMDPRRPARVDPGRIVRAIEDWQVTQSFGSPAIWNVVGQYCQQRALRLPSVRRVLSAGAPVPPHVLERMKQAIASDGDVYTPYGATESLPVASISASEVLTSTARLSARGAGTCVGRPFPGIAWRVIEIRDNPIHQIADVRVIPRGEIGELIVQGPVVTRAYVTRTQANRASKIVDGDSFWHRMGDVGYLDDQDRFWFCGRKAHRVETAIGPMYTVPCEAIFNQHPAVYRSALVGIGPRGQQLPAIICEPWAGKFPHDRKTRNRLIDELCQLGQANRLTRNIPRSHVLLRRALPVDIRHNAKIFREQLAPWAQQQVARAAK
jgi:acyl-CoA synthetase (AMP-forming)/AMP-acid ligase II